MQQFILPIRSPELYNIDDFIISDCNAQAFKLMNTAKLHGAKPYERTILLYGPPASGKTYLAKIWQSNAVAQFYEQDNIEAVLKSDLSGNFIVEAPENWREETLLHLFNIIHEHGGCLLLTTSEVSLQFVLPDLQSRIKSVLKLTIQEPDHELMRILLFKHFSQESVQVEQRVIEFLLPHLPRNFNDIMRIVELINSRALSWKRKITIPLVKEILLLL